MFYTAKELLNLILENWKGFSIDNGITKFKIGSILVNEHHSDFWGRRREKAYTFRLTPVWEYQKPINTDKLNVEKGSILFYNDKSYIVKEIEDGKITAYVQETEIENLKRRVEKLEKGKTNSKD